MKWHCGCCRVIWSCCMPGPIGSMWPLHARIRAGIAAGVSEKLLGLLPRTCQLSTNVGPAVGSCACMAANSCKAVLTCCSTCCAVIGVDKNAVQSRCARSSLSCTCMMCRLCAVHTSTLSADCAAGSIAMSCRVVATGVLAVAPCKRKDAGGAPMTSCHTMSCAVVDTSVAQVVRSS